MKLSGKRLGYLINFNVPKIKDGITLNDSPMTSERFSFASSRLRVQGSNGR